MTQTNYAVAPGEFLNEWMTDKDHSQQDTAKLLGCSRKQVNEIVNGHAPITPETATKLAKVTGIPAEIWLRYEATYQADLARIEDEENLAQYIDLIEPTAASYLRGLGYTKATKKNPGKLTSDFLAFHGCGTWEAYEYMREQESTGDFALAALKESKKSIDPTLLTTWLRAGEMTEAFEQGRNLQFDESALRDLLPILRQRAASPDSEMLTDIGQLLSNVGVVFVVVEPPKKFPLFGITRWIDKRVPVIQQTGRWKKDGFVIWTLFHEIGHILNDPRGEMHVEYSTQNKRNSAAEKSANDFAYKTLFGPQGLSPFKSLTRDHEIANAARKVGIAPGVAVHQMHRKKMLDYRYGNQLCVDLTGTFTG